MKVIKQHIFIILAVIMLTSMAFVNHKYYYKVPESQLAFQSGEQLVYKLYYNLGVIWIPAGSVTFNVTESRDYYEMTALGKTLKSYESLFKVNDYFYSKVDKNTLMPLNAVRTVEEGNYRLYDSISFLRNTQSILSFHGKSKSTAKASVLNYEGEVRDLLSNLYTLRNTDISTYSAGDKISSRMMFDKEIYNINIKFGEKEVTKIKGLGNFNTIKIEPEVLAGHVFKKGDKMEMWISDDGNRIPLLIKSPISVGSIKAVLVSSSNLKHPITSKI